MIDVQNHFIGIYITLIGRSQRALLSDIHTSNTIFLGLISDQIVWCFVDAAGRELILNPGNHGE